MLSTSAFVILIYLAMSCNTLNRTCSDYDRMSLIKTKKQLEGLRCEGGRPSYGFLFNTWRRNAISGTNYRNRDCDSLFRIGMTMDGVYTINIRGTELEVRCHFQYVGHNWIIFQRRVNQNLDFARNWVQYQNGFGDLMGENYWLGLNAIHQLSFHLKFPVLRVDLDRRDGGMLKSAFAEYKLFLVESELSRYRLRVGCYSGNAGDGMGYHHGARFSTSDNDSDVEHFQRNCAMLYGGGGWWYRDCYTANLNGQYGAGPPNERQSMNWYAWMDTFASLTTTQMSIRNG